MRQTLIPAVRQSFRSDAFHPSSARNCQDTAAAAMGVHALDHWREFFRGAGADIWDVIENGILLAAADCPEELQERRCRIAEVLFSSHHSSQCYDCARAPLTLPAGRGTHEESNHIRGEGGACHLASSGAEEKKHCGEGDDDEEVIGNDGIGVETPRVYFAVSATGYGEPEELTGETGEENRISQEVLRIQRVLVAMNDQPEPVLLDLLTRLRAMGLTMEILEATKIGRTVNCVRKHSSKQIRCVAKELFNEWTATVHKWMSSTTDAAAGATPESMNVSYVDQNELDLPPLDEGVLLAMQAPGLELSTIFDGIDEDGNLSNHEQFSQIEKMSPTRRPKSPVCPVQTNNLKDDGPVRKTKKLILKLNKPPATSSLATEQKNQLTSSVITSHLPFEQQNPRSNQKVTDDVQRKRQQIAAGSSKYRNSMNRLDEHCIREKMEATKRKLQEGYRQAVDAKKQRATQVLSDLPYPGLENHREAQMKQTFVPKRTIRRHNKSYL